MRRRYRMLMAAAWLTVLYLGAGLACRSAASGDQAYPSLEAATRAALANMEAGHYDLVVKMFSAEVGKNLSADTLKSVWEGLVAKVGPLKRTTRVLAERNGSVVNIRLGCEFQTATLDFQMAFNAREQVVGFHLLRFKEK